MKGLAYIELKDNNNNTIKRKELNIVTNVFNDYLNVVSHLANPASSASSVFSEMATYANYHKGINLNSLSHFGIRLFTESIEPNPNNYDVNIEHLAYGNTSTSASGNRGIFNAESSYIINEQGKDVGVKLVWDFPTNCANGTINTICLTNKNNTFGENYSQFYNTGTVSSRIYFKNSNKVDVSFQNNGLPIMVTESIIKLFNKVSGKVTDTGWKENEEDYTSISLEGYSKYFKVIQEEENLFHTVAYNSTTELYDFISFNKEGSILDTVELTNLDSDVSNYKDFSICGNHLLFLIYDHYKSVPTMKSYNKTTGELKQVTLPDAVSSAAGVNVLSTIKAYDNSLYTLACYSRDNYGPYYFRTAYFKEQDGEIILYKKVNSDSHGFYSPTFNFGVSNIFSVSNSGHVNNGYTNAFIYLGYSTVYTINQLESPLEKTESNTMKITYELRWSE